MTDTPAVPVTIGQRPLHPRHGIHAPRAGISPRPLGSLRRTSTIDAHRPNGILGDLLQSGRSRDLLTRADGTTEVLGEAQVETRLDYANQYALSSISATPDRPELQALLGQSVSTGFRAAMAFVMPSDEAGATLLHLLLDDLPGAALVSGYAIGAAGEQSSFKERRKGEILQIPGLCAGFRHGSTIVEHMMANDMPPTVTGPPATSIIPIDDPLAWHPLTPMAAHDMRRWRCLDLTPGGVLTVEAYFRDSHMDPHGLETIVHEYTVTATVDPVTEIVLTSNAVAHTLPWAECIEAEASGGLLPGRSLRGLRPHVRAEFTGIATCTHLNDTMRSLEDVRALIGLLNRS